MILTFHVPPLARGWGLYVKREFLVQKNSEKYRKFGFFRDFPFYL